MAISGSENEIRGRIRPDKGRVKVAKILMGNWGVGSGSAVGWNFPFCSLCIS